MQSVLDESGDDVWRQISPLLDTAVASLSETDRQAIVLRFYEGRNLRDVGAALGASEDAAAKRVSRAVERLREFFAKRGVTVGASGLVVVISTNAVQAAPVGLAVTISTAAAVVGTAVTTSTVIAATKAIAMTTLQKTLVAAALIATVGTGIYEARQASDLRNQVQTLKHQPTPPPEQIQQLTRERDDATRQLAALRDQNERLNRNTDELLKLRGEVTRLRSDSQELAQLKAGRPNDATESAAKTWVNRVSQLKQRLEQSPEAKIPELQFVTEQDWLDAVKGNLDSEADYRRASSTLRTAGERKVASILKKALAAYLESNNGQFPTDLGQLQPYFGSPLDEAVLQRWEIAPASKLKGLGYGGDVIITQKAPVDDVFDTRFGIGPNGWGTTDFLNPATEPILRSVSEAFRAAHNGQYQKDLSQLLPYATTPEQQAAIQKLMLKHSVGN